MKSKKHTGKVLDKKDGFSVIECVLCGFKHILPIPSDTELQKLYQKEFYQKEKPNYFKETKEDLPWWLATYANYYSLLEKHTSGRKILDIGSGPGHFLFTGKKRGWDVLGVEPSLSASAYALRRGLPVINDFFSFENLKKYGPFDVVHMSLVLEHVPEPIQFLKEAKKLLKPGGLIAVFCPNDYNPLQIILRNELGFKPWWVLPRHHLNYFDFKSMKKLLVRLGFKEKECLGTFPLEFFLLSGSNYIGYPSIGREYHNKRKKFEMSLYKNNTILLNSIYQTLAKYDIGRQFFIIAKNG